MTEAATHCHPRAERLTAASIQLTIKDLDDGFALVATDRAEDAVKNLRIAEAAPSRLLADPCGRHGSLNCRHSTL